MAIQRRSRGRHEKVIDTLRWGGASHTFSGQAAGSVAQVFVTDGAVETLMRIRGEIVSYADGATAPPVGAHCALGALVVQAGSGTTVIQKPITDPDAPWLFYEQWFIGYEEMVTDVVDVPGITSFRKTIDSKAMRVLRPGREVQLVYEQATLLGADEVNTVFTMRVLLGSH